MSASALLVFARCAGFAFRAPGLSHPSVPHPVRAGLALLLAFAIAPSVPSVTLPEIAFVAALVMEFVLGSAIGIAASLLYDGAYAGGRMIDDYVGVKAIAPTVAVVAPSGFGRVWSLAFTGGYFLLGAYRTTLYGFARSFERIPPGSPFAAHAWTAFAQALVTTIVEVAVAVAAPAIALAFVTQVALAALSRTIPRFASFTLSFPLVFGVVLIATAISIPLVAIQAAHPLMLFPGDVR
ncbi:MAG TPA: flagellar biosynthetic protein FliR [Candidatus Baltobacteraceae bacterium]|nr:flagellar biosynthetic protein FliR [Candidatus Baltobacteraceae bacterium]